MHGSKGRRYCRRCGLDLVPLNRRMERAVQDVLEAMDHGLFVDWAVPSAEPPVTAQSIRVALTQFYWSQQSFEWRLEQIQRAIPPHSMVRISDIY